MNILFTSARVDAFDLLYGNISIVLRLNKIETGSQKSCDCCFAIVGENKIPLETLLASMLIPAL